MKKSEIKLYSLKPGEWGEVKSCKDNGRNITDRLRDLGLCEGEKVKCVMVSPLGDPAAYLIKGSVIALRREDSGTVEVFLEPRR